MDKIEMDDCGPLDHARTDETAEEKSQYHISEVEGVRSLYICDIVICDNDIASGVTLRNAIGGDFAKCDSDIASGMVRDRGLNNSNKQL